MTREGEEWRWEGLIDAGDVSSAVGHRILKDSTTPGLL
jgi:hypothetical protein